MIIGIIAALALQAAAPVQGSASTTPAKPAATADKAKPADKPDPDKKICRRQTPVGSNIEQRICKTQAQWDADAASAQRTTDSLNTLTGIH